MHLGSTAEWLMHGPSAPLIITRSGRRTRSILLAHDGSVHAEAAQDAVATLPWLDQVSVHVVAVYEKDDPRQLVTAAANHLRPLAQSVEVHILRPDDLDVFYRPRDLILESAARLNVDLIALGSRGLTTWESINEIGLHRAGSTASGVAQHAQANVLLAQAPHPTD
jgi:nucleotide-binding universal stress UspA family protein